MRLRTLIGRLRSEQGGFTLTELVTVMAVLSIVVGTLVAVFTSGLTAQRNAVDSLDAQSTARTAMDRMRREVHCASAVAQAGTTMTLTLPAACPSSGTTASYTTVQVAPQRFQLLREGTILVDYLTSASIFSYTPPSTTELGRLAVSLSVNVKPDQGHTAWRLDDEIVLRNSQRVQG